MYYMTDDWHVRLCGNSGHDMAGRVDFKGVEFDGKKYDRC